MKYAVSKYSKTTDELLRDIDVSHVGAENLAKIAGEENVDDFVHVYPIGPKEAAELMEAAGIEIDLSEGDFFLEVFEDGN